MKPVLKERLEMLVYKGLQVLLEKKASEDPEESLVLRAPQGQLENGERLVIEVFQDKTVLLVQRVPPESVDLQAYRDLKEPVEIQGGRENQVYLVQGV